MIEKIILLIISVGLGIFLEWLLFINTLSGCLGCGITPDGTTNLGPYFSTYFFSWLTPVFVIAIFIILSVLTNLCKKFFRKNSSN